MELPWFGIALISLGAGALVLAIMTAVGPPRQLFCADGKRHEFGEWYVQLHRHSTGRITDGKQQRKCKRCGFVELYNLFER